MYFSRQLIPMNFECFVSIGGQRVALVCAVLVFIGQGLCLGKTQTASSAPKPPAEATPVSAPPVPTSEAVPPVLPPSAPHYFFTIDIDSRDQIMGHGALTEEAAATSNCYCFTYDDHGTLQRIEYRRANLPLPDPLFQVLRIDFEYQSGIERRLYRDAQGAAVKDMDGIAGEELTLNAAGFPTDVTNLDEAGGHVRDSSGVIHYVRTLDDQNRLISGKRVGLLGTEITDDDGLFETRTVYDDQGRRMEYANFDASGNPLNDNDGVALTRTTYTLYPDSTQTIESYFDASGIAAEDKSEGIHEVQRTVDQRGFLLSESYFDLTGAPACDIDGNIHERRYEYDDRGNRLSESFFGLDGKPKTARGAGYARVVYKYDAQNRVSEMAYFGDDGTPQVLLNTGAAIVRQEYDSAGNVVHCQYFDGQGRPSPHVQFGAVAIRIKAEGDTTTVSLRDDQDRPVQNPIHGYASFSYNNQTDHPLTHHNHYYNKYGKRLNGVRVFVINPHIHALRGEPVMKWSARIGAGAAAVGSLLAVFLALRKSSHAKRRKVYVPTPLERFLGWFAIFAILEGTLRFVITIYWAWVGYHNGEIGSGVYILEGALIVFFLYRLHRLRFTMRVLNIRRKDMERLVRDYFLTVHLDPHWIEARRSFVTDPLSVRVSYFEKKFHAYLAFFHIHRRDLAKGVAQYIRANVGAIEGPSRSRAIAFYYPCVAVCYFILAVAAIYTVTELSKH
jgi:hypothetical protein